MKTIKNLERLQQIHQLIVQEKTGTPKQLASRLQISERSVHLLLAYLKDLKAPLHYCRKNQTYYYTQPFEIQIHISVTVLNDNEKTEIFGGSYFLSKKYFHARFLQ